MAHGSTRHSNDQTPGVMTGSSTPISKLGSFIDQLVKCRIDVVCKLNLGDGLHSLGCTSDCESYDPLLGQWCIEHSVRTKLICEAHRAPEDTSKGDIFAEEQDAFVLR